MITFFFGFYCLISYILLLPVGKDALNPKNSARDKALNIILFLLAPIMLPLQLMAFNE